MRKGRAHALRELVGCTGLEKQVATNDASPRGAFWHQHCSPVLCEDVWWADLASLAQQLRCSTPPFYGSLC